MCVVILVKICAYSLDMLSLQASGILGDKAKDHKYKFPMMINKITPTAVQIIY